MGYLEFLDEHGLRLLGGAGQTAALFFTSALLAIVLAVVFGLMRLSRSSFVAGAATVYIEFFRGTSLLVQLYWIFFVLPLLGITLDKFVAGVVAVALNVGAYGAELVRGGVLAVPRGQWEAAAAISMSPAQRLRRIILPQALLIMLPPWGNLLIELLKNTALVALIAVADLMFHAKQINSATFLSAQAFGTALIIYYVMARFVITPAMRRLEVLLARKQGLVRHV